MWSHVGEATLVLVWLVLLVLLMLLVLLVLVMLLLVLFMVLWRSGGLLRMMRRRVRILTLTQHHGLEEAVVVRVLAGAHLGMSALLTMVVRPLRAHLALIPLRRLHHLDVGAENLLVVPVVHKLHDAGVAVRGHLVHHGAVEFAVFPVLGKHPLSR